MNRVIASVLIIISSSIYAQALEGVSTSSISGQNIMVSTFVDAGILSGMPIDMLVLKLKDAMARKDSNAVYQYLGAVHHFKPTNEKDVKFLLDVIRNTAEAEISKETAYSALKNIGPEDKYLEPLFLKLLDDKNSNIQYVAMETCGVFKSKKALPILIGRLEKINSKTADKDKDELTRLYGVMWAFKRYGKDGLPDLLKLARTTKVEETKEWAISAIKGIEDKAATPQFMEIVRNKQEDPEIRKTAIESVGELDAKESYKELIEIYKTEKDEIAQHKLLRSIGASKSKMALQFLEETLVTDKIVSNRAVAAYSLSEIGDQEAVPTLLKALETEQDKETRMDIAYSLKRLTGKEYDWKTGDVKNMEQ